MAEPSLTNPTLSLGRVVTAVVIALMGSVVIWFAVPYNNFIFKNTYVSDGFLPEIVVAFLLMVVLAVNPLLRLVGKDWMLNRRQVALIGSLLLFAAVIPSNGLMRMFPRFVAETNQGFNTSPLTASIAADAGFRRSLYPDPLPTKDAEGKVKVYPTPVSDQFIDELEEGASVPWSAWVVPMASWGMLIIAMWAMMLGLGGVVFPQWRDRERLPFPLLNVYQAFTGDPDDPAGKILPPVFRSKGFWLAVIVVFGIHAMRGLNTFTGAVPSFPLDWNIGDLFQEGIMRYAPYPFRRQNILFMVVGVAYFIPNRYAISVWGWMVGYGLYLMLGAAYIPAFEGGANNLAFGTLLSITFWVIWLGRAHWAKVGRAMLGRSSERQEGRSDAIAGWMFVIGCAGIMLWLYWAGCSLWWSVLAMVGCVIVSLLMARIIAETGIPVFWMSRISVASLTALVPLSWQSPAILLFTGVFYALLTRTSAVSASVISTLSLGIDREGSPRQRSRLLVGGLVLMAVGFVICGAIHLNMGYHSFEVATQGKTSAASIDTWARVDRSDFKFFTGDRTQQGVGFVMSSLLLWACSRFPSWPIHPVGLLFVQWSIGHLLWFSVFLGWFIKNTVTNLFGGGAYRKARPIFLGMILGELCAVIFWSLVPILIALFTGTDPATIARYTLITYP